MSSGTEILVMDQDELFVTAAELFMDTATQAVRERGVFTVALAGGKTPRRLYTLLADEYVDHIPWQRTLIFFGDERCVPPDHIESNFAMINEALLSRVPIPDENIFRMKGEIEPAAAAHEYSGDIRRAFGLRIHDIPKFDLIYLGMGTDGHVASIFPHSSALDAVSRSVQSVRVEHLKSNRLTLTPPVIKKARQVAVIVTGADKAPMVKMVLKDDYHPEDRPAQLLRDADGKVTWLLDPEAASMLVEHAPV